MANNDELDARIRSVLGAAGLDAPSDVSLGVDSPKKRRGSTGRRVLMVAASLALLIMGVEVLGHRSAEVKEAAPPNTNLSPSPSTVAQSSGDPTVPDGPKCTLQNVTEYDEMGTMHTVVPNTQPLDASVTVESVGPFCSGNSIVVSVTVHNRGAGMETVTPHLILAGGVNKYTIADLPSFDLQPNETLIQSHEVTLPAAPPGTYGIGLYGLGDIANITLSNPPVCDGTNLSTTFTADGAMGTSYALIKVTNTSSAPCLLGRILRVGDATNGNEQAVTVTGTPGPGITPPLPERVLVPGGSAVIVAATMDGCLDGTIVASPIGTLVLHVGMVRDTPIRVDVKGMLQLGCGFLLADWGAATQP